MTDKVYFQIKDGRLEFAFKGDAKGLKAQVLKDKKDSVKQLETSIKSLKKTIKEIKGESNEDVLRKARTSVQLEASEKELVRVKGLKLTDFEFFTCEAVGLDD